MNQKEIDESVQVILICMAGVGFLLALALCLLWGLI